MPTPLISKKGSGKVYFNPFLFEKYLMDRRGSNYDGAGYGGSGDGMALPPGQRHTLLSLLEDQDGV
jgi:hypothetical protein